MSPNKKRKRDSAPQSVVPNIKIITATPGDFPPILTTTHGIILPPSLHLQPYTHIPEPPALTASKPSKRHPKPEYLLHGSTQRIDYEGREYPEDSEYHRHYVGIYDPATNSVELHVAPKLHFSRTIKAHAERDHGIDEKGVLMSNADSRAALGRQFGTKKAQKALLSREMNKIDISDMDGALTNSIISQVEENTKDMPTSAQLGTQLLDARPIPKLNKAATRPDDVYDLDDIISAEEWNALWVREWEKGEVAGTKSTYVAARAAKLAADETGTGKVRKLKVLRYVAHLVDFYLFHVRGRGKLPAMDKAKKALGIDRVLVEAFYNKFAEKTVSGEGGGDRWSVSPGMAKKVLYYLAVLCLMTDCWEVDLYELKADLGLETKELTMAFKEVGCSIRELTNTQFISMKMTKAEAMQHKRAILKIPLEFPSALRRKATQKRR